MTTGEVPGRESALATSAPVRYTSARLRLALSYAIFLVAAGAVVLVAVYVVLHQVPNYPLTASNPRDRPVAPSRQEILQLLVVLSAFVLAGLAVVGMVGGWVLAGWVLRPLRQINAAAQVAADGVLTHRIRLTSRSDEFRQVADSFDAMLDRLQESFEILQRFAANASHELRTPLAVTATLLEVAERDPHRRTDPELLERLTRTNARAVALVDALLRLAGADHPSRRARIDMADLAARAVADQAAAAERAEIAVEADLRPAPVLADEALVGQVLENLVQNAVRHNLTGGGQIWIATATAGEQASLVVANTGAYYHPAQAQRLREPFLRGAGRVVARTDRSGESADQRGHGLGLSIADRIVRSHGGELDIAARPDGGLSVTVTLPTARR